MKKIRIIVLLTAVIMAFFPTEASAIIQQGEKQDTAINEKTTKVSIGRDIVSIEDNDSAINLKVGNHGLTILESLEGSGSKFRFRKYSDKNDWNEDEEDNGHFRRRNRFRGHWSGIEFGFNNYVNSDRSLVLPDDIDYMTLHSGKSSNFNLNFTQLSLGLGRHIGFVTGLGLNWNNYRFDGNNNIVKGNNGIIEELVPDSNLEKSKLTTLFLTLPFMFELQMPVHHSNLTVAAGPIGAVKLGSHTKMVFENGEKIKSNNDFSLNMLRCGMTARAGYGNFMIYGTYYNTPLFRSGKGPAGNNLYPFEIGIALTFND